MFNDISYIRKELHSLHTALNVPYKSILMAPSGLPRILAPIKDSVTDGCRHSYEDYIPGSIPDTFDMCVHANIVQKKSFFDINQGLQDMIDNKVVGRYVYSWQ